jgi:predicted nucleic acid-binding protein
MADGCVVNASPLIFLARGGHLELLRIIGTPVLVPRPVADEIRRRGASDPTARALASNPWLTVEGIPAVPDHVLGWALGPGETSVIALAIEHPGWVAVIDDMAGRKCANSVGTPVIGTLGIVLRARRQGVITAARPVLEDLVAGGMYLSREVLDRSLALVGE